MSILPLDPRDFSMITNLDVRNPVFPRVWEKSKAFHVIFSFGAVDAIVVPSHPRRDANRFEGKVLYWDLFSGVSLLYRY
jgi:hypothetical protein